MSNNYVKTHLHSTMSNPTYFDSTCSFETYIKKAKELGMSAIAFTEHGNVFQWIKKKIVCDSENIKYIHGSEFYMARDLNKCVRETFHILLYAKNWEGVKELNKLSSISYQGKGEKWKEGNHYYYRPRISMQEIMNTSDNIIISTACLASMFWREKDSIETKQMLEWMSKNKHRCFLEIQPHNIIDQINYNKLIFKWSKEYSIPLIAGTDTHVLNKEDHELRKVLQKGKKVSNEEDEEGINLHFRDYNEIVKEFIVQNSLPKEVFLQAIENTNVLSDMCDNWELDFSHKYPKISENPDEELWSRIQKGIDRKGIRNWSKEKSKQYINRITEEYETFKKLNMCDYIVLLDEIVTFCKENNIAIAPRGSCNGSLTLWAMGITDIDSIKFQLHFFRFVNPERISLGDVDIDMAGDKRPLVKDFLYNYKGIQGSAIITFQTFAMKGATRMIAKGLGYSLEIENEVAKDIDEITEEDDNGNEITHTTFNNREKWLSLYPKWIELAEKAVGIIAGASVHACGFVATDRNIEEEIGTFENGECKWRISQNNMKAIDAINFVKMDLLGVDNVQIIEDACRLAEIPSLNNDDLDLDDENVWEEMKKSGLGIFQFEKSGWYSLKQALDNYAHFKLNNPNISRYDIMLALNGVIRPSCDSFRNDYLKGKTHDNGHEAINEFLSNTSGFCIFQEQIMQFLNLFCGYSGSQSDTVRRGISKKGGTEQFVPEIQKGFVKCMKEKYNLEENKALELVKEFIQIILDASSYGFSTNHSCPYTIMGFKGAYLRHYYTLEYLTAQLNKNDGNTEKTNDIMEFIKKFTDIKVKSIKFRYSKDEYMFDRETNSIYKGISSIKGLTVKSKTGEQLYQLKNNTYENFYLFLKDIKEKTDIGLAKIQLLVNVNFFSEFGSIAKLSKFIEIFDTLYLKKSPKKQTIETKIKDEFIIDIIKQNSIPTETTYGKFDYDKCLNEIFKNINIDEYPFRHMVKMQKDILGYIDYKNEKLDKRYSLITSVNIKYTPTVEAYCLNNGVSCKFKIKKKLYHTELIEGDIIYINTAKREFGYKKIGDKIDKKGNKKPVFEQDENKLEWHITNYSIIDDIDEVINDI
jgi:DNA polymerase-3 subunit alpha